jgi:hypothetical protein
MPCSPNDVSLPNPSGPSGPAIKGFGVPSIASLPNTAPFPDGFPEDLLNILNTLEFLVPPGALKPQLNPNFGKDVFDGIMKMLDQFMPFLMLYKFFLPVLNLIICIIEVLCALMNPFALINALIRLFKVCIPEFLNIFPVFAMIIMIISLLLLLLALVEYLIEQILKLVNSILQNINALQMAFQNADSSGVQAIAKKLGSLLCIFQNFFVLLSVFGIIIDVIKDILELVFSIPPCQDGNSGDSGCCTPNTCPTIVQSQYTRTTGEFKYLGEVDLGTSIAGLSIPVRGESWQLFDVQQPQPEQFRNIFDAFDITTAPPKPIFFPTDSTYNSQTAPAQAAYTLDLRLFYNPLNWGRTGTARFIRFKSCIMTNVPSINLKEGDNSNKTVNNAVALLAGGLGYEDDGTTVLTGFGTDGTTPISDQATLENFIHTATVSSLIPNLSIHDGYTFDNMEYTFKPNIAVLLQKNLVTLGCVPDIALNRDFINTVVAGDAALKSQQLSQLVFPDPAAAQQCLTTALSALRSNLTTEGVAQFQATANVCLQKLQDDTNAALNDVIGIGFDPCSSTFTLTPTVQFTTNDILVSVSLNEKNGINLTTGMSASVATDLANRIKGHVTFGNISNFTYDGTQAFTALLTSDSPGTGQLMISFDNQTFCTNTIPADTTTPPTHTLQSQTYQFVYSPSITPTGEGDTTGAPRRDLGDLARDGI